MVLIVKYQEWIIKNPQNPFSLSRPLLLSIA